MLTKATQLEQLITDLRRLRTRADPLEVQSLAASLESALAVLENELRIEHRKRA
jgi:hypothetical protein